MEVCDEINSINTKKSNITNSITSKQLQDHIDICNHFLHDIINFYIKNSKFDDTMKLADITTVHKNDDKTNKSNYSPISVLPSGWKIFEKITLKQS